MSKWQVEYLPAAVQDRRSLDGSVRKIVDKAIDKVSTNPLPVGEGGYGKPLGNKDGHNLTGLMKVKLKTSGIRIIYQLIRQQETMRIVIIGIREDSEAYREAGRRIKNQ